MEKTVILQPGKTNTIFKKSEGFFLLDAILSLFITSVIIIEILIFVLNASNSVLKTNGKIREKIEKRNGEAAATFDKRE